MPHDPRTLGGWRRDPEAVRRTLARLRRPYFAASAPRLARTGADHTVMLYKAFKEVNGGSYSDYPPQEIGDCVSQSFGHGIDLREAVQIAVRTDSLAFEPTATEAIYGMARVDIGGLHGSDDDGAVGAWAAEAVSRLGTVSRTVTGPYDGKRARAWGADGVPPEIKARAVDHKVRTTSLVATYEELEDALANGYPVTVCSDQGFTLERDADGFCTPEGEWGALHADRRSARRPAPRGLHLPIVGERLPHGAPGPRPAPQLVLGRSRGGRGDARLQGLLVSLKLRRLPRTDLASSMVLRRFRLTARPGSKGCRAFLGRGARTKLLSPSWEESPWLTNFGNPRPPSSRCFCSSAPSSTRPPAQSATT